MDRARRAKLDFARVVDDGGSARFAEVALTFDGAVETGRVECPPGDEGRALFATAEATVAAARALSKNRFSCTVRLAEVAEVCGSEFALVNASLRAGGRTVPVLGSCAARGARTEAVARASLDAINRWLDLTLHGFAIENFDELDYERRGDTSAS